MSEIGNIEAAILAAGAVAISGLTTGQGDRNLDDIASDQFPFAYSTYLGTTVEALDFGQEERAGTYVAVAAFMGLTEEQVKTHLEAWRLWLYADRTLGGLVDTHFAEITLIQSMPEKSRIVGVLTITTSGTAGLAASATASGPGSGLPEEISVAMAAQVAGGTGLRAASDYEAIGGIAAGATVFQVRVDVVGLSPRSSNANNDEATIVVIVHHRLADPTDERAYTEVTKLTDQSALVDPSFWNSLASVLEVVGETEGDEAVRVGDVISYLVAVRVRVV